MEVLNKLKEIDQTVSSLKVRFEGTECSRKAVLQSIEKIEYDTRRLREEFEIYSLNIVWRFEAPPNP